jgi:hypothetical protein
MPIATMDPAFRQQPALAPEADQAIAGARVERAAWTPDAVLAKGAVLRIVGEPPNTFDVVISDADGGVWKGDGK